MTENIEDGGFYCLACGMMRPYTLDEMLKRFPDSYHPFNVSPIPIVVLAYGMDRFDNLKPFWEKSKRL
jgi:hypothetical protein